MDTNVFNFENTEVKSQAGGKKIMRKVSIKKGKGYKSVTKYHKGKKVSTVKKPIHKAHIELIKIGKFIPGLFSDCKCKEKNKTRKNKVKVGGKMTTDQTDIERINMFNELKELARINQENVETYNQLNNRRLDIQGMNDEERLQHLEEYERLGTEIDDLLDRNDQAQERFESLRKQYVDRYMNPQFA